MMPPDYLNQLSAVYPGREGDSGWMKVRTQVPRLGSWGHSWETILKGTRNYRMYCDRKGYTGTDFTVRASKFFDERECLFLEYALKDMRTPAQIASELRMASATARATASGFRVPRVNEPLEVYESCLRDYEREKTRTVGVPKFAVIK